MREGVFILTAAPGVPGVPGIPWKEIKPDVKLNQNDSSRQDTGLNL